MRAAVLALVLLAAACAGRGDTPVTGVGLPAGPPPLSTPTSSPSSTPPAAPARAADLGARSVPFAAIDGWALADLDGARRAFVASCRALERREDASGLTRAGDWASACAAAPGSSDARAFFEAHFAPVEIGDGSGLVTGYYEPELAGSRVAAAGYAHALYRPPPDLVEVDLGQWSDTLKGRRVRGRVEEQRLVPYHDRAAIEAGALARRGLELAWAADAYELFFLHIQGSGRLRLADGTVMRVGYAGQNGRDYTAIGRVLRERGVLEPGQATMDGILGWLRANPAEGAELMRENKSYVFFRELTGPGPLGALSVALTPEVSVAADPAFVPLGVPLWLATRTTEGAFARLTVAQDTGGAIKGANRIDMFWGAGARARAIAGGLSSQGRAVLLLPRAAAERLTDARR